MPSDTIDVDRLKELTAEYVAQMATDELRETRGKLTEKVLLIESQLALRGDRVRTHPESFAPDNLAFEREWMRKAKAALRFAQAAKTRVTVELSRRNREANQASTEGLPTRQERKRAARAEYRKKRHAFDVLRELVNAIEGYDFSEDPTVTALLREFAEIAIKRDANPDLHEPADSPPTA